MPTRMIRVTDAREDDVPLILSFIRELAEYERLLHAVEATEERLRTTLFGARPAAEVRLAHVDDEPVGYSLFFQTYSTFLAQPGLYLEDLYVRPAARGQGVGRALLADLARIARERRSGRVEWTVLTWNAPSIRFYESLGARRLDDWMLFRLAGDDLSRLASEAAAG